MPSAHIDAPESDSSSLIASTYCVFSKVAQCLGPHGCLGMLPFRFCLQI